MFPSGWSAQPAALQQSQAAQTPTGQWGQSVASTTAVGLLDPLTGSSGAAVAVAPFAGSNGGVASWMVPTAPAAPPPVDPWANVAVPSLEDKAAVAREKNRIAQRRFREKERRRLEEVQQAADSLAADIAAVKAEKDQLELEHTLMQKTLAVRNAMLALVRTLEPGEEPGGAQAAAAGAAAGALDDAAVQRASDRLAAAMGELPSPDQLAHIVFYSVGECKPRVFNTFLLANLAPPGPESEAKWLQIAQRALPMLSDAEVSNLRLAYQRLLKRSAIAAVSVKPWVQRLQALTAASAAGVGTLQQLSRLHTQ
ncbi:hypothetical protein ABPG77_006582, partial [Micractinium sp. CCAP 211/92]